MGAPGDFPSDTEILFEQEVTAERRVTAATDALILVVETEIAI